MLTSAWINRTDLCSHSAEIIDIDPMKIKNEARDLHYDGHSLDVAKPGHARDLVVGRLPLFFFVAQLLIRRLQHT